MLRPLYESSAVLAQKTTVAVRTFIQIDNIPQARLENTIGILVTIYPPCRHYATSGRSPRRFHRLM